MLRRFVEGAFIGGANMIPGVSGGTMALIMGIYDKLIKSINTIPLKAPFKILKLDIRGFKDDMSSVDYRFLLPLVLGISVATLFFARGLEWMLDHYAPITFSFFFGLILSSVGVIYEYIEKITISSIISGVLGFLFAFIFVGLRTIQSSHSLPIIFLSGLLSIVFMILPGISGSFLLIFLGQYHYLLSALNRFDVTVSLVFIAGGVTGLFSFTRLMEWLIEKHCSKTMAFLFGLMLGGLRVPTERGIATAASLPEVLVPAALGALLVGVVEYIFNGLTSS